MATVQDVREDLARVTQSTRIAIRCLTSGRDAHDSAQKALSVLVDILDLLYCVRDRISWGEDKWLVEPARLNALAEMLSWFEATLKSIELYFQPGGVSVYYFRKHLLGITFLPRFEQYKILLLLATQPESSDRATLNRTIRNSLKMCRDVESGPKVDLQFEEDALGLTSRLASENFITLADLCNRRLQGTCRWIFDEAQYKQWLLASFRTLYCVGPPGAGKTFLSSAIIDSLQRTFTSPDVATVYVFCQEEKEKEQTSMSILRNILAQLVYRKRSLSYATSSLYYSESLMKGRASPKAYQNAIRAEVNRFSKVFFVVDGLDMFSDKERILTRLQKLPDHTQLLVTLRERNQIDSDSGYVNVLASPEDLQLYTISRIQNDPGLKNFCNQGPSDAQLRWEVVRSVLEKSHGVRASIADYRCLLSFLLTKIHLDLLSRYTDHSLLERAIMHLPESLSEAYGEAMKQVVSQNPIATRHVYWTLYALRPLSVSELKEATQGSIANEGKEETATFEQSLQSQSAGLLTVDAVTGTVRFVHKTAREYLNGTAARVFFPSAQRNIAEVCLTAIIPDEVVDDCYYIGGTAPRGSSSGFLSYAAKYWGYHAREVTEDEQAIQVLIKAFLNKLLWRRPPVKGLVRDKNLPTDLGLGKYPDDWSALHILAFFGIAEKFKRLLVQGGQVDARDNFLQITPLHCAAYRGNDDMVEFLLENGADGNAITDNGSTALHLATEYGQRKAMKLLLTHHVNTQIANKQGATGLQIAVGTAADEATVPLLVKNKVDVNVRNIRTGDTALHLAVEWKRPRIILFLVDKGATIDMTNEDGFTPLQLAAKLDNCEAIALLLQRGAQVEARSLSGVTALQIAAHEGHWIAFDLLLIGGADVNSWNKEGETLLHEQARNSRNPSVAAKLLEHGGNIEARTSQGYTPLQCAATSGNVSMFKFLLERGAKLNVETAKGESLLHITPPVNHDCLEILKIALEHGLDIKTTSSQGWMPLHQAVYVGTAVSDLAFDKTSDYITLLLSHGADINAPAASETAETPLHLAAMAIIPRTALVSLLLRLGADINAMTSEGKTALHLAAERGRESVFRALLDAGADMSLEVPDSARAVDGFGSRAGHTAIDLARKNPFGVLWFDEAGELRPTQELKRRDSVETIIEDMNAENSDDETGESTLVGSEQPYIIV
ncbi:NACHT and Ankyrin domain protein [Aspergillus clavatus NRRL 1]|uniref:NACHT and Ankyrin domain protein n=1 Tax=Aspergillus clavatus (strain ATCC 1007 / CBS 513.65 / DSM 816 / NCTC 3887 / NRRL 1 / QM 1276 / 107) TaxID=344612 RepID=A1CE92_ASPCL|nr:NACHT and Ankyrin domain protein [Aspergillus clavatus NRRL 1]EAW11191.1 NACHT and Ankyrin domain protein [Aspergillus clavatus NRRL 1]